MGATHTMADRIRRGADPQGDLLGDGLSFAVARVILP
jgi:hypothetical protein